MADRLFKRDPRNAPGPFYAVENTCLSCGLPEDEAQELLANLDETAGDTYFIRQPATADEVERACCAIEVCCVSALRYAGDDPAIIQRLIKSADCCDAITATQSNQIQIPPPIAAAPKLSWLQRFFKRGR